MIGDQQAALFGQRCWEAGMAKNTYGTGCFMLMNTGEKACTSKQGLLTTIAWGLDSEINYALEGSVFIAGAAIQWLRDELKLIDKSTDSEHFALQVEDNGGVYLVPAFAGLGAPYWDMYARGTLVGMTRGTNKNHIIRAALESMAYQTKDVLVAMELDAGLKLQSLKVDGAATENQFLMQFQSDLLGVNVDKAEMSESTALGAAFLAGLQIHFWTRQELQDMAIKYQKFEPSSKNSAMETYYKTWKKAIVKAASWIDLDEKNRG
jgi:glycerol kinase